MPDLSAIAGLMSSIKAAKDIAEAMVGLATSQALNTQIFEFQSKMLDAQQFAFAAQHERSELAEVVRELKERLRQFEAWESEKQRYELQSRPPGVFVYSLKPAMAAEELPHDICQRCYQNGKKSILQRGANYWGTVTLTCSECAAAIDTREPFDSSSLK